MLFVLEKGERPLVKNDFQLTFADVNKEKDTGSQEDSEIGSDVGLDLDQLSSSARPVDDKLKEKRERNRKHAQKSRIRKRFFAESIMRSNTALEEENKKL